MAATREAARLTEAHRLAQSRLGVATIRRMLVLWPLLDLENLDVTFERWLRAATPVVQAQRGRSSTLAANYLATFRALELGVKVPPASPVLAAPAPTRALARSLLVTGPLSVKRNMTRGIPLAKANELALAASSRAAMRHVLNGGRETILATTAKDRRSSGRYARVTSAKACAFCDLLASRGAVYSADTADFAAHDGCSCSAEPEYA